MKTVEILKKTMNVQKMQQTFLTLPSVKTGVDLWLCSDKRENTQQPPMNMQSPIYTTILLLLSLFIWALKIGCVALQPLSSPDTAAFQSGRMKTKT